MGRTRGKLKRSKSGNKFVKDRVLRGKIVCNRSSGSIQYGSDGKGGLLGIDRCYVAMKKLDDWRKYSLSEWRRSENVAVETDVEGEEVSSDSEEIISIHSDGGDAEEVTEVVDQIVLSDDSSNEANTMAAMRRKSLLENQFLMIVTMKGRVTIGQLESRFLITVVFVTRKEMTKVKILLRV
jgi:hypothetical protein